MIGILAALALASAVPQDPESSVLSDIIVTAPPDKARALTFIDRIVAPPPGRRLARWEDSLCVSVAGLDAAYAQFVVNRVTAVATSVGLDPGQPGCKPHVLIIFTADPDAAARRLIDEDMDTFRPTRTGTTDQGPEALERFATSDAPVRWWHVSAPVSVLTGELAITLNAGDGPQVLNAPNASRLADTTREALIRAVIIVDTGKIAGASFGALGEYLGVVALTQLDPEIEVAEYATILNLFQAPGQRITDWDQAYLQALYRTRGDQVRFAQQASDIADRMAARSGRPPGGDPET